MGNPKTKTCARKGCTNTFEAPAAGRRKHKRYCSSTCRFKDWHERTYVRRDNGNKA